MPNGECDMYEKYIQTLNAAAFWASRMCTGVYEWDHDVGFGRQIYVGDIVAIPVERKLISDWYGQGTQAWVRGVVYLAHGQFVIDIDNEYSKAQGAARGTERVDRTVLPTWSRHLCNYSYDIHGSKPQIPCSSAWRDIRILGNIAENPELLVR